ncbi:MULTISPECIES: helix-hairpin-helix domain-containing protein [unclassified Streptomyces]|uniref:helix-hairpin-helix domain-containing protein n=1 Tax=unclassified Streptomyces TaxID=2593676 RepID=UPI0034114DF6
MSDGRTSRRHPRVRVRGGRAPAGAMGAEAVKLRAERLFAEGQGQGSVSGQSVSGQERGPSQVKTAAPPRPEPPPPAPPRARWLDGTATDAAPVPVPGRRPWGEGETAPEPAPGWVRGAGAAEAPLGEEEPAPDAGTTARRGRTGVGFAVRERLPVWLQARCGLERRGVIALVAVLVIAATFAAQHFWAGRTQPVRPPEVVRAARTASERGAQPAPAPGPSPQAGQAGQTSTPAGGSGAKIVVDVSGKVRRPGVQRLPAGSRVADALRAAGGVKPGAETDGLNRARFLVDGEQVAVGVPAPTAGSGTGAGASGGAGSGAAGGVGGASTTGPVSLNTATAEQLDELPGVGPVLAQHILDYRAEHGGFRSIEELREVNGIGDRRFADLQDLVRP